MVFMSFILILFLQGIKLIQSQRELFQEAGRYRNQLLHDEAGIGTMALQDCVTVTVCELRLRAEP